MWLLIAGGTAVAPGSANAEPASCHPAELFASDNRDSPEPGQLQLFEIQADATLALNRAPATGSVLLDGVFWSEERQQVSTERSRQFHLCVADEPTLHAAAEALRRQFDQQAVLTFDYPTETVRDPQAALITVPGIEFARFRDAFTADEDARHRLLGGSVSAAEPTLILVAGNGDLDIARRLVEASGGDWATADVAFGDREIVR
ncbi:hypothetical protein [Mycobacterium paragordonae]|uniref:hypothetical protein n=1 Tax=Mycobacterium paragordonae TaxID=1389713 RepID=UPI001F0FDCD8|nr:hypothetical protein [Mycobacterium paragordonae]